MFKVVKKGDPEWNSLDVSALKDRGIDYRGSYRLTEAKIATIIFENKPAIKALLKKVKSKKKEA